MNHDNGPHATSGSPDRFFTGVGYSKVAVRAWPSSETSTDRTRAILQTGSPRRCSASDFKNITMSRSLSCSFVFFHLVGWGMKSTSFSVLQTFHQTSYTLSIWSRSREGVETRAYPLRARRLFRPRSRREGVIKSTWSRFSTREPNRQIVQFQWNPRKRGLAKLLSQGVPRGLYHSDRTLDYGKSSYLESVIARLQRK